MTRSLAVWLALAAPALAAEPTAAEPEAQALPGYQAFLELTMNGIDYGPVLVQVVDGDVWLPDAVYRDADVSLDGVDIQWVDDEQFRRLSSLGATYELDEEALTLNVTLTPDRLPTQRLDLRIGGRPDDMEQARAVSAFLNYGVRTESFQKVEGYSEFGFSVRTARLFTGVTFPWQSLPVRGLTHLTWDHLPTKHRVVAGDTFANGGTLGGGAFVGGLQVSKTYDLDPYFVPGPTLDHQTQVLTPSTLEVYVNGRLARRTDVDPGPLDIQNLPMTAGAGDTRIVLRDALGREQAVTASFYFPRGLLGAGQQEYTYTVGFQRQDVGVESFSYGDFAAMGLHRVGVTNWLTTSARLEGSLDRFSTGLTAATSSPVGQIELAGAFSATPDGDVGGAASLSWSYISRKIGASAFGRYMSDRYTTLTVDPDFDRPTGQAGASLSVPITKLVTTSGSYSFSAMRDRGITHRATLGSGFQLPHNLNLSAFGSWSRWEFSDDEYAVNLTFTATFGPRLTAVARGDFTSFGNDAAAELSRPRPVNNGVGFRVGGQAGSNNYAYAFGDAQAPFLQTNASFEWRPTLTRGSLGVAGGFVGIGGKVFATRPVDSSYALVRVPGVKGVRAYLNNNEVAKTNRRGDAVVQGLIPYYGNRVAISDVDVPLTHAIAGGERVIAPAVRSGAIVAFPVCRLQLVRGVLVLDGADPAYGEVQLEADGESYVSPLGRTGVFELDNLPSGTWRGEATFASGACVIEVEVPSLDTSIIDIGEVRCVTDAVAPAEVTEDPLEPPADTPPDEALSLPVEDAEDALDESGETARTDEVAPSEDVDDGEELP